MTRQVKVEPDYPLDPFDAQIQTLEDQGCPQIIVNALQKQKDEVLHRARGVNLELGNVLFLPVIPPGWMDIDYQVSMVEMGGRPGQPLLLSSSITDVVETPVTPYYIFDIEDGRATRNKNPISAERIIFEEGRQPLNVPEIIALSIHTGVLSRHNVWAAGCRYRTYEVPSLWLDKSHPRLDFLWPNYFSYKWGAASCASRWVSE